MKDLHDETPVVKEQDQLLVKKDELHHIRYVSGLYQAWFLDYASYVILERAVPSLYDGLKPVQRRILHSMKRLDDGRFNKVANIIGYTMQYHPHGDASIGDALVQLGQKDLLIDMQGNWGNIHTGDNAAAPRYIEARLSKFANEVVFNPKTTDWKLTYDGRNKEPIDLPVKFPLLLALGTEGIAVGLASKVLPHNFNELVDACILHLQGKDFELYPDFPTGGMIDVYRYNDGLRGGKVRVRAKISKLDKKMLVINEIPYGKTTGGIIESILAANDKGKIKIKKIDDNTAANVEILVHLAPGISPDKTIDALYAFTDCEVSISPNACVIDRDKPRFMGVSEILRHSAQHTLYLLKRELEIELAELDEQWHYSSLEKIFIENRIYILIEECRTWEAIIETIDKGLDPFKPLLRRQVTYDDIVRLTEIKIKRISRYNAFKADEEIKSIEERMEQVKFHIEHIVQYTIDYYLRIKKKYGKPFDRKTEIRSFDMIEATEVVQANEKLYVNRDEGFVGTGLKKDEYICDCSDIDDIIVFLRDGKYVITKVTDKSFIGKNILYANVFRKNDERTIYNVVYRDGKSGNSFVKRFAVSGITRDKVYDITKGEAGSRIVYFTANPNGEAETIKIYLKPRPRIKKLTFDFDFTELDIKGRSAMGNLLTKYAIHKIVMKEKGASTLRGRNIWFDSTVLRLNVDERGTLLGEFEGDERIIVFYKSGYFILLLPELSVHFEDDILLIEKVDIEQIFTIVYFDADKSFYYVKRFVLDEECSLNRPYNLVGDNSASKVLFIQTDKYPRIEIKFGGKNKNRANEIIDIEPFIGVKSFKAFGKRITNYEVEFVTAIEPIVTEEEVESFIENELSQIKEPEFEVYDRDGKQIAIDF